MIHHGDTEARTKLLHESLTEQIIGAAIEVSSSAGSRTSRVRLRGMSLHEFHLRGISFERQKPLAVEYKGVKLDCGYRLDVIAENKVVLEVKCVEHVLPVHEAQLLTYLKMTDMRVGLILNFNVATLVRGGIVRKVL
jgi:GxxExxY protein